MKLFPTLAVVASAVVLLAGCTSSSPAEQGNALTLDSNTKLASAPTWDKASTNALKGWDVQTVDATTKGFPATYLASTSDSSCQVMYQVTFMQSFNAGRGDAYLSQNYAYSLGEQHQKNVTLKKGQVKNSKGGNVDGYVISMKYDNLVSEPIDPNAPPSTTPPTNKVDGSVYSRSFVRAFDTTMPNGMQQGTAAQTQRGSDPYKGQPVIELTYNCLNKEISDSDWEKVLSNASATVDYATKK